MTKKKITLPEPRPMTPSQERTDGGAGGVAFVGILMMLVAVIRAVTK
jgi:hypothetical protein